jgi:hypothetical protein
MPPARSVDVRRIAVESNHAPRGPDGRRDVGGDGAGAAPDVEDRHAGPEERGEPAMVDREPAPVEDGRRRGVTLHGHARHVARHSRRVNARRSTTVPRGFVIFG